MYVQRKRHQPASLEHIGRSLSLLNFTSPLTLSATISTLLGAAIISTLARVKLNFDTNAHA